MAITDTHLSPLARFAHEHFITPVEGTVFSVSYVAPMAFMNVLITCCAATRCARTMRLLRAADAEQRSGFRWYTGDGLGDGDERPSGRRPRR